jgi:uncharacterized protein (DUF2237 family)
MVPNCGDETMADDETGPDGTPGRALNILGTRLAVCGLAPRTGFFRNGCCDTGPQDKGSHTVCAVVTAEFLAHQKRVGNDLVTPRPEYDFPGLKPGDRWCVCALRWEQARLAGCAPPVVAEATHVRALSLVAREDLMAHRVAASGESS